MTGLVNYPQYDNYKDSGVEWLGVVPNNWELTRLGTRFEERRTKVSDKDYPPLSVTKNGIVPQLDSAAKSNDGDNRKLVKQGDFVINSRSDRKGSSGISDRDGSVSLINIVIEPHNVEPKFCNYLLKTYSFIEEFYRMGHGIVADLWTTRYDEMKSVIMAIPPCIEQIAIANFLDQKTTQIDEAIALKQKQIALLKERKQILIQNAVTQGLNPNASMKDSGIDCIGQIPEHWEVKKLKAVARIHNGMDYKFIEADEGYPVIGSGGQFAYASKYLYDGEAVLLGRKGTVDKPLYIKDKFWTVDTMFYCICRDSVSTKYIYYCSTTVPFKYYSTSTALPSMTQSDLLNHKFSIPPMKEQKAIVEFIEIHSQKIDQAIALQQQQIEKIKEYKTTLINSAVTGKIKVV